MTGLPIGFYTGLFGLCVLVALGSAIFALLRARSIARWTDTPNNEVTPGPRTDPRSRARGRPSGRAGLVAAIISMVATTGAILIMVLFASGALGSGDLSYNPEVQRP